MNPPLRTHETGRKERRRGWFLDPDPGLKDVRGQFDASAARNGEMKVAAQIAAIREAAFRATLAKFALFDLAPNPVDGLTETIKNDDFGYTKRKAQPMTRARDEAPIWGTRSGTTGGSVADRLGFNTNERFGGV